MKRGRCARWCDPLPPRAASRFTAAVHTWPRVCRRTPCPKADRAHRQPTTPSPTHQADAIQASLPISVPRSRPRRVSSTGVKGWYSANRRSAVGIESGVTTALPRKGRKVSGVGALLAASMVFARRPIAADSQLSPKASSSISPSAAAHSTGVALGRKPTAGAIPVISTRMTSTWTMLPSTCPVSTEEREIAIVRKRLTMPSVMSPHTDTATEIVPEVTAIRMIPGTT